VIRAARLLVKDRKSSIERWLPLLGFVFLGIGFCGLGISIMKLTFFAVYKSYLV